MLTPLLSHAHPNHHNSYHSAKEAASLAVNITATAYYQAQSTYNSLGLRYTWPSPYELSEEERQVGNYRGGPVFIFVRRSSA